MDRKRATEISKSQDMVLVNYNGRPIYIEDVNPTKDAASIHFLNKPDNTQEVSIYQLEEYK